MVDEYVVRRRKKRSLRKRLIRSIIFFVMSVLFLIVVLVVGRYAHKTYMNSAYPRNYEEIVTKYAKKNDLPEAFVYAIIKCESGFNPEAVSNIGARGLMQITQDTFDWIQFRMDDPDESSITYDDIFVPEINIRYATFLLRHHLDEFGNVEAAVCAYHAGRGSVNSWLENPEYSGDGKTISHVPFGDTRAYLERVLKTRDIYSQLYYE